MKLFKSDSEHIYLQNISNKCCSFELAFHQKQHW